MKILWNSVAPWLNTGYGTQTRTFAPKIRDAGHDVAFSAYVGVEGTIGTWEGMTVYPADLTRFNKQNLRKYAKRHAGDGPVEDVLVIHLTDVWTWLESRYGGIADFKGLNMAAWVPIDHDPAPGMVCAALQQFDCRPIAMSRFGEDRLRTAGLDPMYVPHGIDTNVFRPYREKRDEIRKLMHVPDDAFVVGMVANNQGQVLPRKSFPQVFNAFAMFLEKHPDAFLYLHTDVLGINHGINLADLSSDFGIPQNRIGFTNQDRYWMNEIGETEMAHIYSAFDVLANPSMGEGFGIPLIEAQACGTPVIATDWTSMTELVGAGWLVDGDPWWHFDQRVWWKVPAIGEILNAFELAYQNRENEELRDTARKWALQYDANHVFNEHWVPTLEKLGKPREVPPLRPIGPNRAQRRAMKQAA